MSGIPLFGHSRSSAATTSPGLCGVYSIGRKNINYPVVLNLEYPIYPVSTMQTSDVLIGAMIVTGNVLLVSWKTHDTSLYGVSALNYSNRNNGAYIESRVVNLEREEMQKFRKYVVNYETLPASTAITLYYKINNGDWVSLSGEQVTDTIRKCVYADLTLDATTLQIKVELTTNGANTPIIESIVLWVE